MRRGAGGLPPFPLLLLALLALGGCQFGVLRENLRVLDRYGYLRGTVTPPDGAEPAPLVVFATAVGAEREAADWSVLPRAGSFFLVVPAGAYRVGAFADRDGSLTRDAGEPGTWARGGEPIEVRPGAINAGLDLPLAAERGDAPLDVGLLPVRASGAVSELPASRIGEVVSLDDARFSEENARLGLWQPARFLIEVGGGIFFLEPYDPHRTPVLFVHGALGHPGNFRQLIDRLDRRRFQAWVAYYPSAVGLDVVGAGLGRWLQALEVEYDFPRLGLVAHSMGGLVARAYLVGDPGGLGGRVESLTFVTIATPWQGHAGAALGVARAPVVAPAWFDLAPGSPFQTRLLETPLPRYAAHDLYFAYGGSRRSRIANDGVITVASQLDPRAQAQARQIVGFDAGHRGVLDVPAVAAALDRSLAGVAPR
jgi:pimeloyl-ACP methyl ester carboxylesterase